MSFEIFMPSAGRPHRQHTLENLPQSLRSRVVLVVQEHEDLDYDSVAERYGVKEMKVLPEGITTLSPTYEKIICGYATADKFFIVDDDLTFSYRADEDLGDVKLTRCNGDAEKLEEMIRLLVNRLDDFAHVGLSARSGNNHTAPSEDGPPTWSENTRAMCFTGYRREAMKDVKHNRVKCRDDFDRHLQLMRLGYANSVLYTYAYDQVGGSNSEGGCSVYRDADMLRQEAEKLRDLHPEFVSVVERKTKSDWGVGGIRTDVQVQWKKAYRSSEGGL